MPREVMMSDNVDTLFNLSSFLSCSTDNDNKRVKILEC